MNKDEPTAEEVLSVAKQFESLDLKAKRRIMNEAKRRKMMDPNYWPKRLRGEKV